MEYLRWREDGTPAAGSFDGWPRSLKEFTMLDPCCGSGHFLVAGFRLLVPLRMQDEGLSPEDACDAVLRENLFGLEIDPRCTQIAAFALALAAWTYAGPDGQPLGYRPLPTLNIACSGQGILGSKGEWIKIGNGDKNFVAAMGFLYDEFKRAPTLGSLIDPRSIAESVFFTGLDPLRRSLDRILRRAETQVDPDRAALGVAAQGIALAASLMSREFTLVATNLPYLARGNQAAELRDYLEDVYPAGKADLATAFVERCLDYCAGKGSVALVARQNWMFLVWYKALRKRLLQQKTWDIVAKLGPGAFDTITGEVVSVGLYVLTEDTPAAGYQFAGLDASSARQPAHKAKLLLDNKVSLVVQEEQLLNPDASIVFNASKGTTSLSEYARVLAGINSGVFPRFVRKFWELPQLLPGWQFQQTTTKNTCHHSGFENVFFWENGEGAHARFVASLEGRLGGSWRRGQEAWGRRGVAVSQMSSLAVSLYEGDLFDNSTAVIVPKKSDYLPAIWAFCESMAKPRHAGPERVRPGDRHRDRLSGVYRRPVL